MNIHDIITVAKERFQRSHRISWWAPACIMISAVVLIAIGIVTGNLPGGIDVKIYEAPDDVTISQNGEYIVEYHYSHLTLNNVKMVHIDKAASEPIFKGGQITMFIFAGIILVICLIWIIFNSYKQKEYVRCIVQQWADIDKTPASPFDRIDFERFL